MKPYFFFFGSLFRILTVIILGVYCISCAAPSNPIIHSSEKSRSNHNSSKLAEEVIVEAKKYLGTPHLLGGMSNSGIDCSGLVVKSFLSVGVKLPRTTTDLIHAGSKVSLSSAKKGDLIFFHTGATKKANHVGIVVQRTKSGIEFVHSSSSRGVMVSNLNNSYWSKRVLGLRRVL